MIKTNILLPHTCEWLLILLQLVEQIGQLHLGHGESSDMLLWKGRKGKCCVKSCFLILTILTGFRQPRQTGFFMHPGPSTIRGRERKTSPGIRSFDAVAIPSFINVSFTILVLFWLGQLWCKCVFIERMERSGKKCSRKTVIVVSIGHCVDLCCAAVQCFTAFTYYQKRKLV